MREILEKYKKMLEILDGYDHQTLIRPKGTYYDGNESVEEAAVELLYTLVKNPEEYDCSKRKAAITFLKFLEWNNALFIDGEKRISDAQLVALVILIDKSRVEEKEMIIRVVLNCILK